MKVIEMKHLSLSIVHPILNEIPTIYVIKNLANLNGKLTSLLFDIITISQHHKFYFIRYPGFIREDLKQLPHVYLFNLDPILGTAICGHLLYSR